MNADPNRQWFLYYQEKESGPFTEQELSLKYRNKGLDDSAYVWTEGLADWLPIGEARVFKTPLHQSAPKSQQRTDSEPAVSGAGLASVTSSLSSTDSRSSSYETSLESSSSASSYEPSGHQNAEPSTQSESIQTETLGAPVREGAEPTSFANTAAAGSSRVAAKPASNARALGLFAAVAVIAMVIGIGQLAPGTFESLANKVLVKVGLLPSPMKKPKPVAATESSTSTAAPVAPVASADEVNWAELTALRSNMDGTSAPFRLANHVLGGRRPVVVGVLSGAAYTRLQDVMPNKNGPLWVRLAIYPDMATTLVALPRLWLVDVPVIDGYFSVGPLTQDGLEVPQGNYFVEVAVLGKNLGRATATVGVTVLGAELTALRDRISKERQSLAEKEKTSLESKIREMNAATEQLNLHSKKATMGPKGAKEWQKVSKPWKEAMVKALQDQDSVVTGAMFYSSTQIALREYIRHVLSLHQALDLFSKSGAAAVQKQKGKGLGQLWVEIKSSQASLNGEFQTLSTQTSTPVPTFDKEALMSRLSAAMPSNGGH